MTTQLKPDAVPFALRNARTIPIAWYDQVKNQLDEMELQGIITPVMEPTDWTHQQRNVERHAESDHHIPTWQHH